MHCGGFNFLTFTEKRREIKSHAYSCKCVCEMDLCKASRKCTDFSQATGAVFDPQAGTSSTPAGEDPVNGGERWSSTAAGVVPPQR